MPLRYAILWCLARGIRHGYDIRRALGDMTDGLWDINPGHVYQAFRPLERAGHVTLPHTLPLPHLPRSAAGGRGARRGRARARRGEVEHGWWALSQAGARCDRPGEVMVCTRRDGLGGGGDLSVARE